MACCELDRLSAILWRERESLELLVSRLEAESLLLWAGRRRWLAKATRDVEEALDLVMYVDVLRVIEAGDAAAALGLDETATLSLFAAAAEPRWSRELSRHHEHLLRLTHTAASMTQPAVALEAELEIFPAPLEGEPYLDLVAAEALMATGSRLLPPSLLDFVVA